MVHGTVLETSKQEHKVVRYLAGVAQALVEVPDRNLSHPLTRT